MKKKRHRLLPVLLFFSWILNVSSLAQSLRMGELILINDSPFRENVSPQAIKNFFTREVSSRWSKAYPSAPLYLLKSDRGTRPGEFMLVCIPENSESGNMILQEGSPFSDAFFSRLGMLSSKPSDFLTGPEKYTQYKLIGNNSIGSLPEVEILGIHLIRVNPAKSDVFEDFVREKLNPVLSGILPDMGLFYYKAVSGENAGSYITIFAISTVEAREGFWPTGGGETSVVKESFKPTEKLAKELENYLVKGTYLLPESGGAAAIFESLNWTDFVLVR